MGVFDTLHSLGYNVYPNSVDETDMEFVPLKDGDFQPAAILGLITLNLRITHQINKDDEEDTEEARAKVYKCTCGAQGDWSYFCNDCPKC